MIDINTLTLDEIKALYPIVSRYDAEAARVTGAKTMADLFRIQTAMFERLNREDKMFVRRDLVETEEALEAAAAALGSRGGKAGTGASKRRDVDYSALGKRGGRPRRSCDVCGSHPAYRKGLCVGCEHAINVHGATRADAHMVECDREKCPR